MKSWKEYQDVAYMCVKGKYGKSRERIRRLKAQGYSPEHVSGIISEWYKIANAVIDGKYGSNWEDKISALGHNPRYVQEVINRLF